MNKTIFPLATRFIYLYIKMVCSHFGQSSCTLNRPCTSNSFDALSTGPKSLNDVLCSIKGVLGYTVPAKLSYIDPVLKWKYILHPDDKSTCEFMQLY